MHAVVNILATNTVIRKIFCKGNFGWLHNLNEKADGKPSAFELIIYDTLRSLGNSVLLHNRDSLSL